MDMLTQFLCTDPGATQGTFSGAEITISNEARLRTLMTDHFVDVFLASTISMLIFKEGLIREPREIKYRLATVGEDTILQFGFSADSAGIQETMRMTNVFNGKLMGCIADVAEEPPGLRSTLWWVKANKLTQAESEQVIDFMSAYLDFRVPNSFKKTF